MNLQNVSPNSTCVKMSLHGNRVAMWFIDMRFTCQPNWIDIINLEIPASHVECHEQPTEANVSGRKAMRREREGERHRRHRRREWVAQATRVLGWIHMIRPHLRVCAQAYCKYFVWNERMRLNASFNRSSWISNYSTCFVGNSQINFIRFLVFFLPPFFGFCCRFSEVEIPWPSATN